MRTFDPKGVLASFANIPISGYADGTFIEVERAEDAYMLTIGAWGEGARARNYNRSGTITFTLLQTSPINDLLSAAALKDELTGAGIGALFIKDIGGATLVSADNAWIKKVPTVSVGKEVETREWVIECESMNIFVGGTNNVIP